MIPHPVSLNLLRLTASLSLALTLTLAARAQPFQLPTANRALFEPGAEERFFVGTAGKPWNSGTFGCVRSGGSQMHEGLDIRCLERDRKGEPIDPIMASADGSVAYLSTRVALSNYGKYIILRHRIEGIEVFTLYAHLSEIRSDLRIGTSVKAGEKIGVMGRTSNTRQRITPDRAHVHFEIDLMVNDRFPAWYKKTFPGQRNDHDLWNGQNLLALDPREILIAQREQKDGFSLLRHIRSLPELCRVVVRDTGFPWTTRYRPLIRRNAAAEREGIAGYEIALNYNGIPVQLIPRAASEIPGKARVQVLSVNEDEQRRHPCRKLVAKHGASWQLTEAGKRLVDLLTY